ncbi:uncharacterized protein BROUX77_000355 [Berkeleyomyces rouxiae]|uniref:uncharacterized protein n=1 Tax=Berkeleyomyces rouxiae TaxID=2035830 RepID=UPI003B760931
MLRHIVPVLRKGCLATSHSLQQSLSLASIQTSPSLYRSAAHTRRTLHVQSPLHQIHGPDDITDPSFERIDTESVSETLFDGEVIQPSDAFVEHATEDDLSIVREVISSSTPGSNNAKKSGKSSSPKTIDAAAAKKPLNSKARRKLRRKSESTSAKSSGVGSIAHALGSSTLAERMAASVSGSRPTETTQSDANIDTAEIEYSPGSKSLSDTHSTTAEADSLKEGAAEVLKKIPEVKDILTKSLKKKDKKKRSAAAKNAGTTAEALEGKAEEEVTDEKTEDKTPQQGKKRKEKRKAAAKKKGAKSEATEEKVEIKTINPRNLEFTQVEQGEEVAKLCHGLERVLFNPGVYHLQDPRSGVFNFDPSLAKIMPVNEFDFRALKEYVTSSKDTNLASKAKAFSKKYSGSTSSMTSSISQFHFLLSAWRPITASNMSRDFKAEPLTYTRITRAPSASFLHYNDGTYAMDADKGFDSPNILSMLGKSMEKLLTLEPKDFDRYHRSRSSEISEEERNAEEAFSFATMGDFIVRSQLDANDKRLPGVGNFDLKTRAVVSIRMDMQNFKDACGYEIKGRYGNWESFEKEYFDMIRSAFLKYSLQVRMGLMDGIFVAYHNTNRIFGFQYISLNEMDLAIHGTEDTTLGDYEFKLSMKLLNEMLNIVTEKYPKQSLRLHIETRPTTPPLMYFFAEPVTKEAIDEVQNANKEEIIRFENEMMAYEDELPAAEEEGTAVAAEAEVEAEVEAEAETEATETAAQEVEDDEGAWSSQTVWSEMTSKAEEAVESDELGLPYVRRAIQIALRQSGLLQNDATGQQGREYVQDLLETLTGTQGEAEVDDVEATEESGVDESTSEQPIIEETPVEEEEDTAQEFLEEKVSEPTEKSEDAAVQEAMEAEEAADYSRPEHPGQSSLKDLIRHLAEQADEYQPPSESETTTDPPNKLRDFERILSELVAKNRTSESKGATEAAAASSEAANTEAGEVPAEDRGELTGLILTIKNKVNGKYATRPTSFTNKSSWVLEYNIQEMDKDRAWRLYDQVKERRKKTLQKGDTMAETDTEYARAYTRMLAQFSAAGRKHRRKINHDAKNKPLYFLKPENADVELKWSDVFGRAVQAEAEAEVEEKEDKDCVHESIKGMDSLVIEPEEDVVESEDSTKESK